MPLTTKRRVFVQEYLQCWNASEAARCAGFKHPGSQGHRLLQDVEVQAHIQERMIDIAMSAEECLVQLADLARGDTNAKIKALELIGKTHKLFVERQEIEIEHGASDALLATISNSLSRGYGHSDESE